MFTLDGWKANRRGILVPPEPITLTLGGIRFAHFLRSAMVHTKGKWARQPIELEPWQIGLFSELLRTEPCNTFVIEPKALLNPWDTFEEIIERPWFDVVTGRRVYREAYIQMPEKQGKSTIMSGLEMYGLGWDGEFGSEVYAAATTTDQARIVFGQAQQAIKRSPHLQTMVRHGILRVFNDAIYHVDTDSVFRVLSSDDAHNEGLNPHMVCLDELWAHKSRALYDTLTSRIHSGTRDDPLAVTITNAGDDSESICYEVYQQAKAVLRGDPDARIDLFAFIPELLTDDGKPDEKALRDPAKWKRVNPASYTTRELLEAGAKKSPPFVFRRRRLNVWTDTAEAWLDPAWWDACEGEITADPDAGDLLYLGVDMGLKRDTAAVTAVCPKDGKLQVFANVWGIKNEEGEYPPCHDEVDDTRLSIKLVEDYILALAEMGWEIACVAYDPYRFERSAQELSNSVVVVQFNQTDAMMCPASEDLYVDVRDGVILHDGDPILRRHVMAGVAQETGRGAWRIVKRLATRPTDALIGMTMGCAMARAEAMEGRPTIEVLA